MKVLFFMAGSGVLALILLALCVPSAYQEIKVILLLLTLFSVIFLTLGSKLVWSGETLLACAVLAMVGLANSLHGEINSALGAIRVLTVMTVWPMLFAILSALLNRPNAIKTIVSTLAIAFVAVLAYSFLYLGNAVELVPDWAYFALDQGQAIGFYDGTLEYNLYSIASLLFLMPFWTHFLLNLIRESKVKMTHWAALLIGLVLCALTGRRAVQLVVLISPLIVVVTEAILGGGIRFGFRLLYGFFNRRNTVVVCGGLILLLLIFASMDIRLDALIEDFINGFNFDDSSNESASERANQFYSLMHGWFNGNFWFGAGNGSSTDYLRSDDTPWAYELTYVYLLFSTGIAGVLFYFGWFGWGLLRIRNALMQRSDMRIYVAPMISGVFGFAIGAASNPYFSKFDYLWIIMLPHLLAGAIQYQRKVVAG